MTRRRQRGTGTKPRQRKDGRWTVSVPGTIDESGRRPRVYAYAATRDAALAKRDELLDKQRKAALTRARPDKWILSVFLDEWLKDSVRARVREATFRLYELVVRRHIRTIAARGKGADKPGLGQVRLDRLSPRAIRAHYADLERADRSPRVRQLVHVVLHQALKDAVRLDAIPRNPVANVDAARVARQPMHIWSPEQVRKFLEKAVDDRYYALYVLAFTTGMRKGELLALQWHDIDLEAGTLSVRHTLVEVDGKWRDRVDLPATVVKWRLAEPKTARGRGRIDLLANAVEAVRSHRAVRLSEGLRASEWCFPSPKGKRRGAAATPTNARSLTRYSFEPLMAIAELPRIRFHDIRHTAASMWLAAGIHPKVVQERLVHASIGITLDTYSHVLPAIHREAADRIGTLIQPEAAVRSIVGQLNGSGESQTPK